MVLWEITLGTAYFLGLKRTYKLALKLQRKLIGPKYPKIRQFLHSRTRNVFDVAIKVHLKIQERDIEVGRNLGNWILRWLDKMKPEAQIRGKPPLLTNSNTKITKQSNNSSHLKHQGGLSKHDAKDGNGQSDRHLFSAARNVWANSLPTVAMMVRPSRTARNNIQYRQYATRSIDFFTVKYGKSGEVARNDIRQWILHR